MSTFEGNGFRSLDQYKRSFTERVTHPELLDQAAIHVLLFRVAGAPQEMGAFANLARIQDVRKTTPGIYAVQFVFLSAELEERTQAGGEFFDGIWNPTTGLEIESKPGQKFDLKDGFVKERGLPGGGSMSTLEARDLELAGV